jgi:hypothetical protein
MPVLVSWVPSGSHLGPLICPTNLFNDTGSHFVAQAGLEHMILLLPPPMCWDYKFMCAPMPSLPAYKLDETPVSDSLLGSEC